MSVVLAPGSSLARASACSLVRDTYLHMTNADADELARTEATDFARGLASQCEEALGSDLLGAYLIGSLAHGGFSARYSDIDMAIVTLSGLSAAALDHLRSAALVLSPQWGPKLSVFWTDQHFSVGRFPPLDRVDYLDHAIALTERERVRQARPTLEEIRDYLRGAPFAGWAERAHSFAGAQALRPEDRKAYLRTLLYPGRFCYSWITGRMGSNADAVAFLNNNRVAGLDIGLLERALASRDAAADPEALFPARALLPSQIDACAALLG